MERLKKEAMVAELQETLGQAQAVFVTDFKGLRMETLGGLRRKIRQGGGEFRVTKNTLIKLAAKGRPAEKLEPLLVGNNALGSTVSDPAALAKALQEFAKEQEKFVIKGGLLGDRTVTPAQIKALAALPGREALLSSLLGTMQAVPTSFVRVLAAVPQKLVYCLAAIREQKSPA
ncbi:MAG: 50S ribosomal protein L10 [Deltaproteobacteria bacterium]|nr:50S ribosomal protein L10 [Deltaproteobacteria bacterium]